MRDLTVLRQIVHYLDGWSGLRARVVTEDVAWPSVHVQAQDDVQAWQCVHDHWTGQLLDTDGTAIATIETTIAEDASAGEVADRLKAIYRMLRSEPEIG